MRDSTTSIINFERIKELLTLEGIEYLRVFLEILNEQSNRCVSYDEIEKEFMKRVDPKKNFDREDLRKEMDRIILYSKGLPVIPPANKEGIPDENVPRGTYHSVHPLENSVERISTLLIEREKLSVEIEGKTTEQNCYSITVRGIQVLNNLRNSGQSKGLLESSKRLEVLTWILISLTGLLIVYSVTTNMISFNGKSIFYNYPLEVGFGTVIVIAILFIIVYRLYSKFRPR